MRIEYYEGINGQWYWRLRIIRNGKIIADGAEGYASKSNVKRAVARIVKAISEEIVVSEIHNG